MFVLLLNVTRTYSYKIDSIEPPYIAIANRALLLDSFAEIPLRTNCRKEAHVFLASPYSKLEL